jgi:predicted DsbA family dithiol-disulfide isomerase
MNQACVRSFRQSGRRLLVAGWTTVILLSIVRISAAQSDSAKMDDLNRVVATLGSHKITQAEIDREIKPQLIAWQNQLYQNRLAAINKLADQYTIDQAAKKAHLTPDEFLKQQLAGREGAVTDEQARQFYEQHKNQIQQPYDEIRAPLIKALQRRNDEKAHQQMIARLRSHNHVALKVMIEPPRLKIATEGYPSLGPKDAPVTLVEFTDFQCPYCKRAEEMIKNLRQEYSDKLRLVVIDFPLAIHQYSFKAAEAGRCASEQSKFWEYHDTLFKDQSQLTTKDLKDTAAKLQLNTEHFNICLDTGKYAGAVQQSIKQGGDIGVNSTPALFINGRPVIGPQPVPVLKKIINEELTH